MQAVLIIAHKQPEQVMALAKQLVPTFKVWVHFDTKMKVTPAQQAAFDQLGVHTFSKIDVRWGGWSIGQVAVELFKAALKDPEITHLHLISGQDWPVQAPTKIAHFYENDDHIYMKYFRADQVRKSGELVLWWQKYYFPYDKLNRRTLFGKIYHRVSLHLQRLLGVNKLKRLGYQPEEIYSGENWVDLPRDAAEYAVEYFETHPKLQTMLKTGAFSDEFWLPIIFCNQPEYRDRIIQKHYRYILWKERYGSRPAILDLQDLPALQSEPYFWARKVVFGISDELTQHLPLASREPGKPEN